jgi:hypothetical protein
VLKKIIFLSSFVLTLSVIPPVRSNENVLEKGQQFDLSPEIIESSPVLQQWLEEIPNVLEEIKNQPSFPTRIRVGYVQFPSNHHSGGVQLAVEDIFIANTNLTLSGEYYTSFSDKNNRLSVGGDLHYYLFPLGSYANIAPVVGYRYLETNNYHTDGVNVGARLVLSLSPSGAGDIFITQSFVSPGSNQEVGITQISAGYAITKNMRLSTDIQWQNSVENKDSKVGILLEWIPR